MEIIIEPLKINICPYCRGIGKLKAMQSMSTLDGVSIMGKDTTVKCKYCNGAGVIN